MHESNGHGLSSVVVLDCINGGLHVASFQPVLQANKVAKLQRQRRDKYGVVRAAKLHNRGLVQTSFVAARRSNLHRDSNGGRPREKLRQLPAATHFACRECRTAGFYHGPHASKYRAQLAVSESRHTFRRDRTQTAVGGSCTPPAKGF